MKLQDNQIKELKAAVIETDNIDELLKKFPNLTRKDVKRYVRRRKSLINKANCDANAKKKTTAIQKPPIKKTIEKPKNITTMPTKTG